MRGKAIVFTLLFAVQPMLAKEKTGTYCDKNISFAVAEAGQVVPDVPVFADKWINKNQKRYGGLCFSQTPDPRVSNYLLLFATSQTAFNGVFPTVRTSTSRSTSSVSGSGTITDNYGGFWSYTYDGTVTTTATTTTHENVPYTDTSNTLFLYSYDQHGRLVSRRWRTITTRQGGDPSNTFGYNLGASLSAIHFKEHLLKDAVQDVARTVGVEAKANSWHTEAYCEKDGYVWINNECHAGGDAQETAAQTKEGVPDSPRSGGPNYAAMPDEEYAHRYGSQSWCEVDALHGASAKRDLVWKDGSCHAKNYAPAPLILKP